MSPLIFAVVTMSSLFLTWIMVRRGGLGLDTPNHRSSHTQSTPRGGGAAFVIVAIAAFFIVALFQTVEFENSFSRRIWGFAVLTTILGFLGAVEDMRNIPASTRLTFEAIIACLVIPLGIGWKNVAVGPFVISEPTWFLHLYTIVWMVWLTNLYNFMDGINGIATLTGVVIFGTFSVIFSQYNSNFHSVALIIVFSILGFLPFNFPKAKIFMGDMGSLFLGYCVGFMALLIHNFNLNFSAFWAIIAITPFFFDSTITLIIRMFCGQNILTAHRWHAFQKLADLTKSHTIATLVYTTWQIAFSWVVLAAAKDDFSNSSAKPALALFAGFAVFYCTVLWLAKKSSKSTAARC